ncbi:MAG: SGNH/GDSL hydrolase family protein [Alphaproteobacteria bacterium]
MANQTNMRWVGSWAVTPSAMDGVALEGQTVRMVARVSIGGETLRVRLSNAYGTGKLDIGAARVALRGDGAGIIPDSSRPLTFNGATATTIPPGALAVSDPVEFDVVPLSDLVVSLHLPGRLPEDFRLTGQANARQTNYISEPGDHTEEATLPVAETRDAYLFLSGVEVLAPADTGGIVAIGDSLTICNVSEIDANNRWPNQLASRLDARGGRGFGIMNQGIGGNRIVHDARGGSTQARFDRDVLAQPGVSHVILFLGINDIRNRAGKPEEDVTAGEMIAGLNQLATRAHAAGLKIFGGTMLTYENENFNPPPGLPGLYTAEGEVIRQAVNGWIRDSGAFDAVIDFERALADPAHPTRMLPEYDCGDHLHPSDAGYLHMGDIIDLDLFD